jgi:hypothetical protein
MNAPLQRIVRFALITGVCAGVLVSTRAQTDTAARGPVTALKSPVAAFRELLAMKPADRERFLAERPADKRAGLLDKIREYEAMKPEERELTLSATELQFYLEQMVNTAPTNRAAQLAAVPAVYRRIIGDRLGVWDIMPPDLQQDMLAHEATRHYFLGAGEDTATNEADYYKILPPPLQDEVARLGSITPEERQQSYEAARQFFGMSEEEKNRVLRTLSAADRAQVGRTVEDLQRLPRGQLDKCMATVVRLADLSDAQRREFLKNAGRWREMPPADRAAWDKLADRLPPLPPGLEVPTPDDVWKIMPPGLNNAPVTTNAAQ